MTRQRCICDRPDCKVKSLESPFTINYGEVLDRSWAISLGGGAYGDVFGDNQVWCGQEAAFKYNEIKDMKELVYSEENLTFY